MMNPQNKKEVNLEDLDKRIKEYVAFLGESKKYEEYKEFLEEKSLEEQEKLAQEMLASLAEETKIVMQGMTNKRATKKESSEAKARRAEFEAEKQKRAQEQKQKRMQREQRAKEAHARINEEMAEQKRIMAEKRAALERSSAKNWEIQVCQDENEADIVPMTEAWRRKSMESMMESRMDSDRNFSKNRMHKFIQRQYELGEESTKHVQSLNELTKKHLDNKKKKDPQNNFQRFSGEPYRWAAGLKQFTTKEDLEEICLVDEKNDRHERVVAMHLADYAYDRLMYGPTAENPKGKYGYGETRGPAIIGVTRFDKDGTFLRTDFGLVRLEEMSQKDKEFFKNTVVSEEWIEHTTDKNCRFLGGIAQKNGEYYIECNWFWDMNLVESLKWAEYNLGVIMQANGQNKKMVFSQLIEELQKMQTVCVEGLKNPIGKKNDESVENPNKKVAGGDVWER